MSTLFYKIFEEIKLNLLFLELVLMKKKFSGTEIVGKLRQADVLMGRGKKASQAVRSSTITYFRCVAIMRSVVLFGRP